MTHPTHQHSIEKELICIDYKLKKMIYAGQNARIKKHLKEDGAISDTVLSYALQMAFTQAKSIPCLKAILREVKIPKHLVEKYIEWSDLEFSEYVKELIFKNIKGEKI